MQVQIMNIKRGVWLLIYFMSFQKIKMLMVSVMCASAVATGSLFWYYWNKENSPSQSRMNSDCTSTSLTHPTKSRPYLKRKDNRIEGMAIYNKT
jgi:hypothetical protein